jgi:hypothetical protein
VLGTVAVRSVRSAQLGSNASAARLPVLVHVRYAPKTASRRVRIKPAAKNAVAAPLDSSELVAHSTTLESVSSVTEERSRSRKMTGPVLFALAVQLDLPGKTVVTQAPESVSRYRWVTSNLLMEYGAPYQSRVRCVEMALNLLDVRVRLKVSVSPVGKACLPLKPRFGIPNVVRASHVRVDTLAKAVVRGPPESACLVREEPSSPKLVPGIQPVNASPNVHLEKVSWPVKQTPRRIACVPQCQSAVALNTRSNRRH